MPATHDKPLRVLVVEDDAIHAMVIQQVLGEAGPLDVRHVPDGEEAMEYLFGRGRHAKRLRHDDPELVLLDIRLPGVDGFDVLGSMREHAETRPLPVVMLSTSDSPDDIRRGYAMGANAFITKSPDFEVLTSRLLTVCRFFGQTVELPSR